jgi:ABC-type transport system substrate-binding protein
LSELDGLVALAGRIRLALEERELTLSTAESCTGGLLGHVLTEVPGISEQYRGGMISYSNELKSSELDVPQHVLRFWETRFAQVKPPVTAFWTADADGEWGNNLARTSTEEIDDKFDELMSETDPDRYAELANEIDRLLWEEVVTIPMFERPGLYAMDDNLHNWGEFGLASDYVYEDIGWAKED